LRSLLGKILLDRETAFTSEQALHMGTHEASGYFKTESQVDEDWELGFENSGTRR
jgi:hypothetical protein